MPVQRGRKASAARLTGRRACGRGDIFRRPSKIPQRAPVAAPVTIARAVMTEPVAPFAAGPGAHAETIEALTERLDTSPTGLTHAEAGRRLNEVGPNRAATPTAISPW